MEDGGKIKNNYSKKNILQIKAGYFLVIYDSQLTPSTSINGIIASLTDSNRLPGH